MPDRRTTLCQIARAYAFDAAFMRGSVVTSSRQALNLARTRAEKKLVALAFLRAYHKWDRAARAADHRIKQRKAQGAR
jgi:hypothetical protein